VPSSTATAGQDGAALLEGLDRAGTFTLQVRPPADRSDLLPSQREDWKPADTVVRLAAGLMVAGVVLDGEGRPVARCTLWGRTPGGPWRTVSVRGDGTFEIGPFPAGPVELLARPERAEPTGFEERVTRVQAGAADVKLPIEAGADLRVVVIGWPKDRFWGNGTVTPDDGEGQVRGYLEAGGKITFRGLREDLTWTLYMEPLEDGRIVYVKGLHPGGPPVEVPLVMGGEIKGRLLLPPGTTDRWLDVSGRDFGQWLPVGKDGAFTIRGVPPGKAKITAGADTADDTFEATVEAKAGDEIEIDLTRK
jgi:hypothetical protein